MYVSHSYACFGVANGDTPWTASVEVEGAAADAGIGMAVAYTKSY